MKMQIKTLSKGCPACGTENADNASKCRSCGNALGPSNPWPR